MKGYKVFLFSINLVRFLIKVYFLKGFFGKIMGIPFPIWCIFILVVCNRSHLFEKSSDPFAKKNLNFSWVINIYPLSKLYYDSIESCCFFLIKTKNACIIIAFVAVSFILLNKNPKIKL